MTTPLIGFGNRVACFHFLTKFKQISNQSLNKLALAIFIIGTKVTRNIFSQSKLLLHR